MLKFDVLPTIDFLSAKDFKKNIKGRSRSEKPNQRADTREFKF